MFMRAMKKIIGFSAFLTAENRTLRYATPVSVLNTPLATTKNQ